MNEIKIFENEKFGSVRTIEENGKVMFCGKDAAMSLGYKRPADAISAHCKGVCELPTPTAGGVQKLDWGDVKNFSYFFYHVNRGATFSYFISA